VNVRTTATAKSPSKTLFKSQNAPSPEIGSLVLLYRRRFYQNWHLCTEVDCTDILYVPKVAVPKKLVPKVYVPKLSCTKSDVPRRFMA